MMSIRRVNKPREKQSTAKIQWKTLSIFEQYGKNHSTYKIQWKALSAFEEYDKTTIHLKFSGKPYLPFSNMGKSLCTYKSVEIPIFLWPT